MSRYLIALCTTAMIAGLPAARLARATDVTADPPSRTVQIYGAELSNTAGIARVHERLTGAARDVCHTLDAKDLGRQMLYRRCVAAALARAVRDVHDARLSAYHEAKTGATRTVALIAGSPASR